MLLLSSILLLISALEFNEAKSLRKQYELDSLDNFRPSIIEDFTSTKCDPAVIDPAYELIRAFTLFLNPDSKNQAAYRRAIKRRNSAYVKSLPSRKSQLNTRRQFPSFGNPFGPPNDFFSNGRGSNRPPPTGGSFQMMDGPNMPNNGRLKPYPNFSGGYKDQGESDDDDYSGGDDYSYSDDDDDDYNSGDMNYNYNFNLISRRNSDAKALTGNRRSHNNHHHEETRRRTLH